MKLGIFAKTFAGTSPHVVMQAAVQAGYQAVQYNMACSGLAAMPESISTEIADDVAAAAREANIGVAAVSCTYNMIHPDKAEREQGHHRLEVIAAQCRRMNTRLITLCTGTRDAGDQWRHHPDNRSASAWKDLVESIAIAAAIADRHDVALGIEPELANVVNSAESAKALIDEMGSPRLCVVLDAANLFENEDIATQRRIVAAAAERLANHIAMAHAKDRARNGSFVAAGHGVLDYPHYLSCLRQSGFNGPLVAHGLTAGDAPVVARFLRNVLAGDRQ